MNKNRLRPPQRKATCSMLKKLLNRSCIILLVLWCNNVFSQNVLIEPEPFPIPLDSVSQLHYLVPLVNGSIELKDSIIIIYGFTGCKPCEVLLRKVQKKIDAEAISVSSVMYVNIFVLDSTSKRQGLVDKRISFPYYATESPYVRDIEGAFPMIVAYANGIKTWSLYGYSPANNRKMLKYLNL